MKKPNLFSHATSELSNDAILCWMFEWGNHKDEVLYKLSNDFMKLFLGKQDDGFEISKLEIKKQYKFDWRHDDGKVDKKYIDILLLLETNSDEKHAIIIEDKVDSKENNNQLEYYKQLPSIDGNLNGYKPSLVYIKIGEDSDLDSVRQKGFKVISRTQIIDIMKPFVNMDNQILNDYYDYLKEIDEEVQKHQIIDSFSDWSWRTWQGYYSNLQDAMKIKDNCWGYVPNRNGGFFGYWWAFNKIQIDLDNGIKNAPLLYLQIEEAGNQARIAFKIQVEDDNVQSQVRNHVWYVLRDMDKSKINEEYRFQKTNFSKGRSMTIAEIGGLKSKEQLEEGIRNSEIQLNRIFDAL